MGRLWKTTALGGFSLSHGSAMKIKRVSHCLPKGKPVVRFGEDRNVFFIALITKWCLTLQIGLLL